MHATVNMKCTADMHLQPKRTLFALTIHTSHLLLTAASHRLSSDIYSNAQIQGRQPILDRLILRINLLVLLCELCIVLPRRLAPFELCTEILPFGAQRAHLLGYAPHRNWCTPVNPFNSL